MDYCDATDETGKNPEAKFWLLKIANGDMYAFDFMWSMWNWSHVIDDLVDGDKPVGVEVAAKYFIRMSHELVFNPFFLQHRDYLFSMVVSMFNRWCDGEEWERSDDTTQQTASHVIKCGDIELYLSVAYLTGGWDHVRNCRGARSYDLNGLEQSFKKGT